MNRRQSIQISDEISESSELIQVSCRVICSLIQYLKSLNYDTNVLIEGLPYSCEYLCNPLNWVPYTIRDEIQNRAISLTSDDKIMYLVGLNSTKLDILSGLKDMLRLLGNPASVYKSIPKYSILFDKITSFETKITKKNTAIISMTMLKGFPFNKQDCYYAQGILAAIPTIWDLPAANVKEIQCASQLSPNNSGNLSKHSSMCIYEVTWQEQVSLFKRKFNAVKRAIRLKNKINKLETNFILLDQQNRELIRKNEKLNKIREISLGINNVTAINEVWELIVEASREISGIRFVLIHMDDKNSDVITTPYFSKIRNKNAVNILKSFGVDPYLLLGSTSTANRLQFPKSKMKLAHELRANHKTISREKLRDILTGALPDFICDGIQRALNLKRIVLVPITVNEDILATICFLLNEDISTEFLEMIGAHCATAINNVNMLESLKRRNSELTSINMIANKASVAEDMGQVLGIATREAVKLFNADASALLLFSDKKDNYMLTSAYGITDEMTSIAQNINLRNDVITRFFLETNQLLSGNLADYVRIFPKLKSLVEKNPSLTFIAALLKTSKQRYGILVIIRGNGRSFNTEEHSLITALANQLSISLENSQLVKNTLNSEEKLRLTLESVDEGILVTDLHGIIIQVNEPLVKMFGYRSKEEIINKNAFILLPKSEHENIRKLMGDVLDKAPTGLTEFIFIKENGDEFSGEVMASLLKDASDEPAGFVSAIRDITKRKTYEQQLLISERKYRLITDSTADYIGMYDFKGICTYASPSHKYLGYDPEELIGKSGFDFIHPEDRKKIMPLFIKYTSMSMAQLFGIKQTSFSEDITFRYKDTQGQWHYIEATANLAEAFNKRGLNILIIGRDRTEKKQAEDKLKESEEKYRTIFETANDILVLLDKFGKIIDINGKVTDIGGYKPEELIGKDFKSFTNIMSLDSIAKITHNLIQGLIGLEIPTCEIEMFKKSGEMAFMEASAMVVRKEKEIVGFLAILRDITERKKSVNELNQQKELVEQIIATTPNSVIVIDNKMRMILANPAFYRTFDLTKAEVSKKKSLDNIIPVESFKNALQTILSGDKTELELEFTFNHDNIYRIFVSSIFNMQYNRYLIILHDVAEERARQERLYLTDRLASVGEMASGIAHELNNPLTSIIGLSELLADEHLPQDAKTDINAIHREALRAAAVVRNFLVFARKHQPKRELLQVNKVIQDIVDLRSREHKINNIKVFRNYDNQLPEIMGDYFQLQQVFLNIILNAEYAIADSKHRGNLDIRTNQNDNYIEIIIEDDGPGIKKENLGKVFDPFFTTKEVGKGTGLGLSICYGIISSHSGRIYVESEENKGARFIIKLPIKPSPETT
jgi:two-component system NtrC family sensor kinase